MNKKIIISSITLLIVISLIIFYITLNSNNNILPDQNNQENNIPDESPDDPIVENITPVVIIELDNYNKTITIVSIEKGTDLVWSNVELLEGDATIPEGSIDEGDIITDCTEILDFKWIPTNEIFLHVEFVRGE